MHLEREDGSVTVVGCFLRDGGKALYDWFFSDFV